jgi:ribulose-phosphate 3-epimerase
VAREVLIAPSILSADFSRLAKEVEEVEQAGADLLHVDVMDGHFVPNITVGPMIVEALRSCSTLPLDVHLMIEHPELYIESFVQAGAGYLSIHAEGNVHLHRLIEQIKSFGVNAGVAINPATPLTSLAHLLEQVDYVLVMSVDPGFGGQEFIPASFEKIKHLRKVIEKRGVEVKIAVDGGVNPSIAAELVQAGADILVAGYAIFGEEDRAQALHLLRETASQV